METTGIDLTKCVNLRFRLRIDGTNYFGRIGTDERGRNCLFCDDGKAYWIADSSDELQRYGKSYLEIFPRDPETYTDWQVGDIVCEGEHRNVYYEVIFRSGELVIFKGLNGWASNPMTCSEAFTRFGRRLVLTGIERQIIEEKKKYEPQDGDVCFVKTSAGNCFIFIKRDDKVDDEIYCYASFSINGYLLFPAKVSCVCDRESIRKLRPATEDEKQQLFEAMANEGKRWNAEKKVVEDIPEPYEFKAGEPVLVRNGENTWRIAVFSGKRDTVGDFKVIYGNGCGYYDYCIPYNEKTMHLLGTTENYKEE